MVYSGDWGKLIHEKNQQSKISWHCPFNFWKQDQDLHWSEKLDLDPHWSQNSDILEAQNWAMDEDPDPDPHLSEKLITDPIYSEKLDPDVYL